MAHNIWLYLLIMATVSYLIRMAPLALIRREITNKLLRSFLFYVPYATLAVMTFPAIMEATQKPATGFCALIAGIVSAWKGCSLFQVAVLCCAVAFVVELLPIF